MQAVSAGQAGGLLRGEEERNRIKYKSIRVLNDSTTSEYIYTLTAHPPRPSMAVAGPTGEVSRRPKAPVPPHRSHFIPLEEALRGNQPYPVCH